MTYNEKKTITNIISSILITSIYAIIIYNKYLNGVIDDSNIFKFWAIIILIFIPISIIARIIIMIIFHIIEAVYQKTQGEDLEDEMDIVDERDKIIQMKANTISVYVFSIGFIIALITQLFNVSNHLFFIILFSFGFISDLVSEILMFKYYRKGF